MSAGRDAELRDRGEALFVELLPLGAAERSRRLGEACADLPTLRAEVESLLAHHDADQGMLDRPAPYSFGGAVPAMGDEESTLPPVCEAGGYLLRSVLGSGGMGTVYVAEQLRTRRTVGVKVIRRGSVGAGIARRFEHEAAILARLLHPGIAQIFEASVADFGHGPQPFIAMELVDGLSLTDHAEAQGLSVRDRMELIARVCDAVHHAHQRGVIHRDLKPANILVVRDDATGPIGQPKILDFGVARATGPERLATTLQTGVGQIIGTLPYMSPEQVSGDSADVDTRSDIYGLGVLLYRLLCGRLPHDVSTRSMAEAARIIRDEMPVRISSLDRTLCGDVESIVNKALEKDRDLRYPTAAEFGADLRRANRNEPIVAHPATTMYYVRKFVQRNRALAGTIMALAVVVVGGALAVGVLAARAMSAAHDADESRKIAERESEAASAQAREARRSAYLANIAAASAATSAFDVIAARRSLDAVDAGDRANWEWRYLDAAQDDAIHVLLARTSAVYSASYSPDQSLLAASSYDGIVRLWDLSRNEVVGELPSHGRAVYSTVFSPDGATLASGGADGVVRLWDVATRSLRQACVGHTGPVRCVAVNGGGTLVASTGDDGMVRFWSLPGGEARPELTKRSGRAHSVAFAPDGRTVAIGCNDRVALLWPVHAAEPSATLRGHASVVFEVAFSPDGSLVASASQDGSVRIWRLDEIADPRPVTIFAGQGGLHAVAFSPESMRIATAGGDMAVRIFNAINARPLGTLTGHVGAVRSVAWSADGARIASASADVIGSVRIWDVRNASLPQESVGLNSPITSLEFSPDGAIVTILGGDNRVAQVDAASALPLAAVALGDLGRDVMRVRTNGRSIVSLMGDASGESAALPWLSFRNADTWAERARVECPTQVMPRAHMAVSPDDRIVAISSDSASVMLVNADDMSPRLLNPPGATEAHVVTALGFSADGGLVASVDSAGILRIWRVADGHLTGTVDVSGDATNAATGGVSDFSQLVFSPDASTIAVAGAGTNAPLIDVSQMRVRATLTDTTTALRSLAYSPDGLRIATGGSDGRVQLWDPLTAQLVLHIRLNAFTISALAFSPDGSVLAAGSDDRRVRYLRARPIRESIEARERLEDTARTMASSLADREDAVVEGETPSERIARLLSDGHATPFERRARLRALNITLEAGTAPVGSRVPERRP